MTTPPTPSVPISLTDLARALNINDPKAVEIFYKHAQTAIESTAQYFTWFYKGKGFDHVMTHDFILSFVNEQYWVTLLEEHAKDQPFATVNPLEGYIHARVKNALFDYVRDNRGSYSGVHSLNNRLFAISKMESQLISERVFYTDRELMDKTNEYVRQTRKDAARQGMIIKPQDMVYYRSNIGLSYDTLANTSSWKTADADNTWIEYSLYLKKHIPAYDHILSDTILAHLIDTGRALTNHDHNYIASTLGYSTSYVADMSAIVRIYLSSYLHPDTALVQPSPHACSRCGKKPCRTIEALRAWAYKHHALPPLKAITAPNPEQRNTTFLQAFKPAPARRPHPTDIRR